MTRQREAESLELSLSTPVFAAVAAVAILCLLLHLAVSAALAPIVVENENKPCGSLRRGCASVACICIHGRFQNIRHATPTNRKTSRRRKR